MWEFLISDLPVSIFVLLYVWCSIFYMLKKKFLRASLFYIILKFGFYNICFFETWSNILMYYSYLPTNKATILKKLACWKNMKVLDLDMNKWVSFLHRVEIQIMFEKCKNTLNFKFFLLRLQWWFTCGFVLFFV